MTRRLGWLVLLASSPLIGCAPVPCPDGFMRRHEDTACIPIAPSDAGADGGEGSADAGPDSGPDTGPCGMACVSATPACDERSGTCVQCDADDLSECVGINHLCHPNSNTCVGCFETAGCDADPIRPICDSDDWSCRGCAADTECEGLSATPVCDEPSGRCVACTVDSETAECGGMSCDPALFTCTATPVGLTPVCGACVADSECGTDHYCVPMTFNSAPAGAFCMKALSAGCARPFLSILADRVSLTGEPEADYCGIDEATVSCGAVRALLESQECSGGTDGECGADGALCRMVGAADNRCTYGCSTPDECPMTGPAATCGSGHCGS